MLVTRSDSLQVIGTFYFHISLLHEEWDTLLPRILVTIIQYVQVYCRWVEDTFLRKSSKSWEATRVSQPCHGVTEGLSKEDVVVDNDRALSLSRQTVDECWDALPYPHIIPGFYVVFWMKRVASSSKACVTEKEALPRTWLYFSSKQLFPGAFIRKRIRSKVCVAQSKFLISPCSCPPPSPPHTLLVLFTYSLEIVRSKNVY